jgi:hypothetical protein
MIEALKNINAALAVILILLPGSTIVIAPDLFQKEMIFGLIVGTVWLVFIALADYLEKRHGW